MRRAIIAALLVSTTLATPAHAGGVLLGLAGLGAGGGVLASVGTWLTTNFVGRVVGALVISALQAKLAKRSIRTPGLRSSVTQTGGVNPMSFIVGRYATAGTKVAPEMSHGVVGRTPNAYLTQIIDLGDVTNAGYRRLAIDGAWVTLGSTPHADYGLPVQGKFAGRAWVKIKTGAETSADAMLLAKYGAAAQRPWMSDMIGRGVPHVILTYLYDPAVYNGLPVTRHEIDSTPLYDPRKDSTAGGTGPHRWGNVATYEATDNPVVILYNVWRGIAVDGAGVWGGGVAGGDMRLTAWKAAMDRCDAATALAAGGTEPRFRTGFEIRVDDEPFSVADEILIACNGDVAETGGTWTVRVGEPGLPVYFFTDADCLVTHAEELEPFPSEQGIINAVSGTRPAPEAVYEPKETPLITNAAWEAEDLGQRRPTEVSLAACTSGTQAQRVLQAYVKAQRRMRSHKVTLPPDACVLEPLDTVSWTSARNGYVAKLFEVVEVETDPLTMLHQASLREVDPTDYSWSTGDEQSETVPSADPETVASHAVKDWAVTAISLTDGSGADRRPAVRMAWDGAGQVGVTALDYEVRRTGTTALVTSGSVGDVAGGVAVASAGILPLTAYEVRGKFRARHATSWTAWTGVTTLNIAIGRADLAADAVHDTFQLVVPTTASVAIGTTNYATLALGPIPFGNIHLRGLVFEARGGFDAVLERRRKPIGGVFDAWSTVATITVANTAFEVFSDGGQLAGAYDDYEYRLTLIRAASGYSTNEIRNLYLTVKRITSA